MRARIEFSELYVYLVAAAVVFAIYPSCTWNDLKPPRKPGDLSVISPDEQRFICFKGVSGRVTSIRYRGYLPYRSGSIRPRYPAERSDIVWYELDTGTAL